MKSRALPGFFALGRLYAAWSHKVKSVGYRVVPADDVSEHNAVEAHLLGLAAFAFWILIADALLSPFLPWFVRIFVVFPSVFVLLQVATAGIAAVLGKTLVERGTCTASGARSLHTRMHLGLIICLSICIAVTGYGSVALSGIAWLWILLAAANLTATVVMYGR